MDRIGDQKALEKFTKECERNSPHGVSIGNYSGGHARRSWGSKDPQEFPSETHSTQGNQWIGSGTMRVSFGNYQRGLSCHTEFPSETISGRTPP